MNIHYDAALSLAVFNAQNCVEVRRRMATQRNMPDKSSSQHVACVDVRRRT